MASKTSFLDFLYFKIHFGTLPHLQRVSKRYRQGTGYFIAAWWWMTWAVWA